MPAARRPARRGRSRPRTALPPHLSPRHLNRRSGRDRKLSPPPGPVPVTAAACCRRHCARAGADSGRAPPGPAPVTAQQPSPMPAARRQARARNRLRRLEPPPLLSPRAGPARCRRFPPCVAPAPAPRPPLPLRRSPRRCRPAARRCQNKCRGRNPGSHCFRWLRISSFVN